MALLIEKSIRLAAARCGVDERTLRRWLTKDETFKANLADARQAIYQAAMNRAQALTGEAIDTLGNLMTAKMPPNVRLAAARTVMELGMHQHDAQAILQRVEELEARERQAQGGR